MDTSETYTKMCDCEEVQKGRQSFDCFDFLIEQNGLILHSGVIINSGGMDTCRIYFIWLPRQDQIQEMCEGSWWGGYCNMTYWADSKHFPYVIDEMHSGTLLKSMEQLWLAFYMDEKHQKHWDGKSWV